MSSFKTFLREQDPTYHQYLEGLTLLSNKSLTESVLDIHVPQFLVNLKDLLVVIAKNSKVGFDVLVQAFKTKNVYQILKAFRFDIILIWKSIVALRDLVEEGLLDALGELVKTDTFQKLRSGAIKTDEVISQHPILKHVSGIVIAGLLFYMWLHYAFTGKTTHELDMSEIAQALIGKFSLADLFASTSGLEVLTLFSIGAVTGFTFEWLAEEHIHIVLALAYTGFLGVKSAAPNVMAFMHSLEVGEG